MVALAAFRTMMADLNFSQEAADEIFTNQGVDSPEVMSGLSDSDVETLMRILRKPGGGGNGTTVPFVAEKKFKYAVQMARHYYQTQRVLTFANIRTAALGPFETQRRVEQEYRSRAVTPDPPKVEFVDHPKSLEQVVQYLGQHRGAASGTMLSYTVRRRLVPLPAADDPAANYLTLDAE